MQVTGNDEYIKLLFIIAGSSVHALRDTRLRIEQNNASSTDRKGEKQQTNMFTTEDYSLIV